MRKSVVPALFVLVILVGVSGYFAAKYVGIMSNTDSQTRSVSGSKSYEVKEVTNGLYVPWSIAFTSETRFLVTERDGKIREFKDGQLTQGPLLVISDVSHSGEEGLMGLVVDPNYNKNHFVYASYAYNDGTSLFVKIVRLLDAGSTITVDKILLDKIPAASFHAGSRLKIGPDGKLYITTGDASEKTLAQDPASLAGKILRINLDGTVPTGNPFPNSPVYSYGHRNPQGIDWNRETDLMISTEHGPSLFDAPAGGDEINVISAGKNYGWPLVSHERTATGLESPRTTFTPAVAPASALIYSGKLFPQFKGNLFFGGLRGEGLFRVELTETGNVISYEKLANVTFGRIRDVVEAPTGEIYFSTSNTDGRGTLRPSDDKIYKLTPGN